MFDIKYRPKNFSEFIGNQIEIQGLLKKFPNWPSSFLIVGPPGVGKTTLGRLIANQLGCNYVKEIDAGSERGIDHIREIRKVASEKQLFSKSKVFIFDECQGLTTEAQQALLKPTEEAPKNTYFIFCSTDPQKIVKALKERCYQIVLERVSDSDLGLLLKRICKEEEITVCENVKKIGNLCIENADGIPRKAIKLFEKFYQYKIEDAIPLIESSPDEATNEILEMVNALDKKDLSGFLQVLKNAPRKNFEGIRISLGNIYKNKLSGAIIGKNNQTDYYTAILETMFLHPVDNYIGDIELICRVGSLKKYYKEYFD